MINTKDYTVILAEDDIELRKRFSELIKGKGFSLVTAKDGSQLYNKALNYAGDLGKLVILSDTDMPKYTGDEACKKLLENKLFKEVIMIGMSGGSRNEAYWKGVEVWQTFIYKGLDIDKKDSGKNIAEMLTSRLETILENPSVYKLKDGSYRRTIQDA